LAAADSTGKVQLIDTASGQVLRSFAPEGERYFETVSFTPDGGTVAAAASGRVELWNPSTGRRIGSLDSARDDQGLDELLLQTTPQRQLSFSADGSRLAVRERGGVLIWDLTKQEQVGARQDIGDLTGVAISGDGRMLLVATSKGLVLWDPMARQPISDALSGKGYDAAPESIVVSPAGGTVLGLDDAGAFVWTTDVAVWAGTACRIAARSLTEVEWNRYVSADQDYRPACPGSFR
jgi:WD40 repeat protein